MTRLALEVLPLISPILHWVEGRAQTGLPPHWHPENRGLKHRCGSSGDLPDPEDAWLRRELPNASLDTFRGMFQAARHPVSRDWLSQEKSSPLDIPSNYILIRALDKLSAHFFQWVGNELCILEHKVGEIHLLARRFPVPQLIRFAYAKKISRGYLSDEDCLHRPMRLAHLPSNYNGLRTQLEKGLYEGHLHLVSLLGPEEIWVGDILSTNFYGRRSLSVSAEGRVSLLGRCLVSLLAVVLVLDEREIRGVLTSLKKMLPLFDEMYMDGDTQLFYQRAERLKAALKEVTKELNRVPSLNSDWLLPLIHPKFRNLSEKQTLKSKEQLMVRFHLTLLGRLIRVEERLSGQSLIHSRETVEREPMKLSEKVLNQLAFRYFVIQTHHWQQTTQKGLTTGLSYFGESRKSPIRRRAQREKEHMDLALDYSCQVKSLAGLEGRIAPPKSFADLRVWLLNMYRYYDEGKLPRFGLVVHFKKTPKGQGPKNGPFLRHGEIHRTVGRNARRLFRLLGRRHPLVPFIVGIDAAGHELCTPPEVFAPAFRFLRDHPVETTAELSPFVKPLAEIFRTRRLGMTFHAGEDFHHLLSGLRAIDEVVTFLNPQPGDRLGHATALATDPRKWLTETRFQTVIPQQEFLDNMVWIHHLLGAGHPAMTELAVMDKIQIFSRIIYAETNRSANPRFDWSPATLFDAWRLRQLDPTYLDGIELENRKLAFKRPLGYSRERLRWLDTQYKIWDDIRDEVGSSETFVLLAQYWYNQRAWRVGQAFECLDMYAKREVWADLMCDVQQKIRQKLVEKQMVIETCPTSNVLIGPIAELADHQIYPLTLDEDHELKRELRVTVNTDNPGVFVTSLEHEYYLIAEVLLREGVPESKVINWIEWLRQNGRDCSFLKVAPDPKALKNYFADNEKFFKNMGTVDVPYFWEHYRNHFK